ncbi:MAG TPA: hypothetical protein DCQ98_20915 [Planctomycetaceae bacterium]|nr:hypothetical protein [Planctomycetaceae bacterium]HRF00667.1 S8 family serine peptidase [Pirellulaceae bacterium]
MSSSDSGRPDPQRRARFETFEERLAFSGQALDSFALDPLESPELLMQVEQLEIPAEVAPVVQQGGLESLVYGLTNRHGLTGAGQTVAVIDSGIAWDHVALGGGYGSNHRVVGGWDFAENDSNPYDDGPAGFHGTHVAGIIGSSNSTYQGVAPGADLVALRVFDDQGRGQLAWVEQALQWVYDHRGSFENPITTVNLSIGTSWNSTSVPNWATLEDEFQRLEQAGIFVSVAAGNSFQSYQSVGLSYPAASPFVVPVASHGASGQLSSFSQRAPNVLVAPGESIMSTVPEHLWGSSAQSTRFLAASGTSMAAPYVAGASMLVRQAMETLGYQEIDQDLIYDHFRSTADIIRDTVTNADYYRINLQRALDSLFSDDFGDTVGDRHELGTLSDTRSVSGFINDASDVDVFGFTAGGTGRVTLHLEHGSGVAPRIAIPGVATTVSGNSISFDVVSGQSYSIVVDSTAGVGAYGIDLEIESVPWSSPPIEIGPVEMSTIDGIAVAGETWLRVQATNSGFLTLEAMTAARGAGFRIDVYDDDLRSLGSTTGARVDARVTADATYLIRISGNVAELDLRAVNVVDLSSGRLVVHGTSASDDYAIDAGRTLDVRVGAVSYSFDLSQVRSIQMTGGAGSDSLTLTGDGQRDFFRLTLGSGNWDRSTFSARFVGFETIAAIGGGGNDSLILTGSAGNDTLVGSASFVSLTSGARQTTVAGIADFTAFGGGGVDSASLSGTTGNDRFWARSNNATLFAPEHRQFLADFDHIAFDATQGGFDSIWMSDTEGNDVATLGVGSASISGAGYSITATGFESQSVQSMRGGSDSVTFTDSAGNDTFFATTSAADMKGSGYYHIARGFASVTATSSGQAGDVATLLDSAGSDLLDAGFASTTLSGRGFSNEVRGFASVWAHGGTGNAIDAALFRDSAGDDRFYYSRDYSSLRADGNVVGAYRFRDARALASAGGVDTAIVVGTSGVDRVTTSPQNDVLLQGSGYRARSVGFQSTHVSGGGGRDVAILAELGPDDELFGQGKVAQVSYGPLTTLLRDFAYVQAMIGDDAPAADIRAVDFHFEMLERRG